MSSYKELHISSNNNKTQNFNSHKKMTHYEKFQGNKNLLGYLYKLLMSGKLVYEMASKEGLIRIMLC